MARAGQEKGVPDQHESPTLPATPQSFDPYGRQYSFYEAGCFHSMGAAYT